MGRGDLSEGWSQARLSEGEDTLNQHLEDRKDAAL